MKRDYILYLEDIVESIQNIENYVKGMSFESFIQDKKTIDAVIRKVLQLSVISGLPFHRKILMR